MSSQSSVSNMNRKRPMSSAYLYPSKRMQSLAANIEQLNLAEESLASQHSYQDSRPSLASSRNDVELEENSQESSGVNPSSAAYRPNPTSKESLLNKSPIDSERLKQFNTGKHTSLKKFITDPRNIKDGDNQRRYLRDITNYLKDTGYKGTVPRNIRALGNRDFQGIFKHLFQRIDPYYKFEKKFEDDILIILKKLNYPLVDSISPKSLLSVGALHSNPSFFALLQWMTEACKSIDASKETDDVGPSQLEMSSYDMTQLFYEYSTTTYFSFLSGANDYSKQDKELEIALNDASVASQKHVDELSEFTSALREDLAQLESQASPLNRLKQRNQELNRDLSKFHTYCEDKRKRVAKYKNLNDRVKEEIKRLTHQLEKMEKDKAACLVRLQEKNVTEKELTETHATHIEYETQNGIITAKLEEVRKSYNEKLEKVDTMKQQIQKDVNDYNYQARNIPSSLLDNHDIKIKYDSGSSQVADIIPTDIENDIKPKLEDMLQRLKLEFESLKQETVQMRENMDSATSALREKEADLELLGKKVETLKKNYEIEHQNFMNENENYNSFVDSQQREAEDKKTAARNLFLKAKRRLFEEERRHNDRLEEMKQEKQKTIKLVQHFLSVVKSDCQALSTDVEQFVQTSQKQLDELSKVVAH